MSEWIKYGHNWKEFVSDDLNQAGTEIEVRDSRYITGYNWYIIGHINRLGDDTGHCRNIREGAIITQYRDLTRPRQRET